MIAVIQILFKNILHNFVIVNSCLFRVYFQGIILLSLVCPQFICVAVGFLNLFIFYWRIIALQNLAVLCQTSTWISQRIHIFHPFWISFPFPSPPHPSRLQLDLIGPFCQPQLLFLCLGSSRQHYNWSLLLVAIPHWQCFATFIFLW